MRHFLCTLAAVTALTVTNLSADDAAAPASPAPASAPATSLYDLKVTTLDGKPADLAQYKGQVVLVVNVASKCGFTPEYTALEKLYTDNKDKGLVILGFPSNDFKQEPGTAEDITAFCTSKYQVTFPMFEKVAVKKGPDQSPVYQYLTSTGLTQPTWNFCKYLVDKNGKVTAEYPSPVLKGYPATVTPDTQKFLDAVDAALKS
jgi:glutathione peroxidase